MQSVGTFLFLQNENQAMGRNGPWGLKEEYNLSFVSLGNQKPDPHQKGNCNHPDDPTMFLYL